MSRNRIGKSKTIDEVSDAFGTKKQAHRQNPQRQGELGRAGEKARIKAGAWRNRMEVIVADSSGQPNRGLRIEDFILRQTV